MHLKDKRERNYLSTSHRTLTEIGTGESIKGRLWLHDDLQKHELINVRSSVITSGTTAFRKIPELSILQSHITVMVGGQRLRRPLHVIRPQLLNPELKQTLQLRAQLLAMARKVVGNELQH